MSGIHSLDVEDFDADNGTLTVEHRPDTDTRLKNRQDGERIVTIDERTTEILSDYIEHNRYDTTDDHGRTPMFTSKHGRMSKMNLNKRVYQFTSPCYTSQDCPGARKPEDCEHTGSISGMVECPYNSRPHAVRGGSITYWLRDDAPNKMVSDRVDASMKTLDQHYDERSKAEKAEQRRDFFEDD